jgi:hypothetical protein
VWVTVCNSDQARRIRQWILIIYSWPWCVIYIYIVWFLHYCCIYIVLLNWIQYTPNKTLNPKWKKKHKTLRSTIPVRATNRDHWPRGIALQRVHVETYRSRFVLESGPALVLSDWARFGNRDQWPKWTGTIGPFSTSEIGFPFLFILLIRLKRIYNFWCSMLVYTPFSLCFVILHGVFMHFPELTH